MTRARTRNLSRLNLVRLEDRTAPAMIAVTNLANAGPGSLRQAILNANNELIHPGEDTIIFVGATIGGTVRLSTHGGIQFGPNALEVTSQIIIQGNGVTIRRDPPDDLFKQQNYRLFYVSRDGSLTLRDLTLADGLARGGNGGQNAGKAGGGGGGGLGAGGAIFNQGALTITRCLFVGNAARGGNGGAGARNIGTSIGGSGGGGMGGDGAGTLQDNGNGGSGGGGFFGSGARGGVSAGGGGGGSTTNGSGQTGGTAGGGAGGNINSNGGNGSTGGGGGGAGFANAQTGGSGVDVGGGGGGGGNTGTNGSRGGFGGFGGGGGGGGMDGSGGPGGFGGGGGASNQTSISLKGAFRGGFGAGASGAPGTSVGSGGGGGGGGLGGAIFNHGGTVSISNSTFSGNSAVGGIGGFGTTTSMNGESGKGMAAGLFNRNGTATIQNTTFTNNTAQVGRGIMVVSDGREANIALNNSILGQSDTTFTDYDQASLDNSSVAASAVGNLIRSLGSNNLTGGVVSFADPKLGPLADNGGPTFTHVLLAGSPALDAGNNASAFSLGTDQRRGTTVRIFNGNVDIGAVEVQPALFARPVLAGGSLNGNARLLGTINGKLEFGLTVPFFPNSTVNVRTAMGDVDGDGFVDFIGGTGPGSVTQVKIISGSKGNTIAVIDPFESAFAGGVFVAAGDFDGDGKADIVVTPDQGGGPIAAVYSGAKLSAGKTNEEAQFRRFFAIEDPFFRGGARPAAGDLNSDGQADLVVSAGFQGGPRIAIFDGISIVETTVSPSRLIGDFFAFEPTLRNGAFVAVGDVNGDGFADLFFGAGPAGGPRVRLIDGAKLLSAGNFGNLDAISQTAQLANFFAGESSLRGGVRLALADVDNNGILDLITGSGDGEPSRVRVFKSPNLFGNSSPSADQILDPFGETLVDGVYVGG